MWRQSRKVESNDWNDQVLTALAAGPTTRPDFVVQHWYPQGPNDLSDQGLFMSNSSVADTAIGWKDVDWSATAPIWNDQAHTWDKNGRHLRQQLQDAFHQDSDKIEMLVTENNSCFDPMPTQQMTSLTGGLYLADSIGSALQTGYNGLVWWDFQDGEHSLTLNPSLYGWRPDGDFGILNFNGGTAPPTFYPTYYVSKMLRHFARGGDTVVSAVTGYDLLSAYAAKRQDGSLSLLVINKSKTTAITGNVAITGFVPSRSATAYTYGMVEDNGSQNGIPTDATVTHPTGAGTSFSSLFGAYSVTVLTLVPTAPALASVTAPSAAAAGGSVTGMVTLSDAAPLGGLVVTLSSSNRSVGSVPSTVTIPAGAMSAQFTITTGGVAVNTSLILKAQAGGITKTATLLVTSATPSFKLSASASPAIVVAGGKVTLSLSATDTGAALANSVVDIEVWNSVGTRIGQAPFTGQNFAPNGVLRYSYVWPAPAAPDTYTVKAGVFAPGSGGAWGPSLAWNDNAAAIKVVAPDTAHYNFEASTQGWTSSGAMISGVSTASAQAYAGAKSLAVTFKGSGTGTQTGTPQVSVNHPATPTPPAGTVVTFHVWVPSGNMITAVQPYVQQGDAGYLWTGNYVPFSKLTPNSWNTITVTVPAGAVKPLTQLGVQFLTSGAWSGTCYVDAVGW